LDGNPFRSNPWRGGGGVSKNSANEERPFPWGTIRIGTPRKELSSALVQVGKKPVFGKVEELIPGNSLNWPRPLRGKAKEPQGGKSV